MGKFRFADDSIQDYEKVSDNITYLKLMLNISN